MYLSRVLDTLPSPVRAMHEPNTPLTKALHLNLEETKEWLAKERLPGIMPDETYI